MRGINVKNRILIFPYLAIYDYKSIEDNLTAMAAKGWRTEGASSFLWKFKRAEPSNKKFSVIFADDTSERKRSLEEICVEGGWKKEFQGKQIQIFYADKEAIPLETDELIRLENIHLNMKKTFIPNWIKALLLMIIIAFSNGMSYFGGSPYMNGKAFWAFLVGLQGAFIAGCSLLGYLLWLKISRKKISKGGTCVSTSWYRRILIVMIIGFLTTGIVSFINIKIQIGEGLIFYIIIGMMVVLAAISLITLLFQLLE